MAHVGKNYKLWFRRDANWDLNNYKFGYPECYFILSHQLIFSARYAVSQIKKVDAVNLYKTYDRVWTSPTYGGFFDNVYWQLEFVDPPDEPINTVRFKIWHDAIIDVPLFDATYGMQHHPTPYYLVETSALMELHWLSPDITVDPERFLIKFAAARWGRYPPP
jgi:hypothetical protein